MDIPSKGTQGWKGRVCLCETSQKQTKDRGKGRREKNVNWLQKHEAFLLAVTASKHCSSAMFVLGVVSIAAGTKQLLFIAPQATH